MGKVIFSKDENSYITTKLKFYSMSERDCPTTDIDQVTKLSDYLIRLGYWVKYDSDSDKIILDFDVR